jgi:hypothetical protein
LELFIVTNLQYQRQFQRLLICLLIDKNVKMSSAVLKMPGFDSTMPSQMAVHRITRSDPFFNIFAGSFGGLCSLVVGYPLDTVKVRLQVRISVLTLATNEF